MLINSIFTKRNGLVPSNFLIINFPKNEKVNFMLCTVRNKGKNTFQYKQRRMNILLGIRNFPYRMFHFFYNSSSVFKKQYGEESTNHTMESIYQLNNKILNRHELVDLNKVEINEEIRANLKFILKIHHLYMYQYIVFHEIRKNKHMLVYSKTGSGKTLSYLLPLIQKLINEKFHCNKKILIVTQNTHLCKQLYIYILSIYPTLNVCTLFDHMGSTSRREKEKKEVNYEDYLLKKSQNQQEHDTSGTGFKESLGIHIYLCTPNKLELYIKQYTHKGKQGKNVLNNILNCVDTIVIDEFDYIIEHRALISSFLFQKNLRNIENRIKQRNEPLDMMSRDSCTFNFEEYNIYLFTANINSGMKNKLNEYLNGFLFFDFVNGNKERFEKKIGKEGCTIFQNPKTILQILSKEGKSSGLCSGNVSHFICKINTSSKLKYVPFFLNEFFFSKNKKEKHNSNCIIDKEEFMLDHVNASTSKAYLESEEKINKCIIFTNTKEEVERLYESPLLKPISVMLHSELLSLQKNENINLFRMGKKTILITTDLISRGFDVDHVIFILNCSPPKFPSDYVHRSGRTGRGKSKGVCLTLYHKNEYKHVEKVMNYVKNTFEVILCPKLEEVYQFSIRRMIQEIMNTPPEEYSFLNKLSEQLLNKHGNKIIAQLLTTLVKCENKNSEFSLLSEKRNYVAIFLKDPFFEIIKNKDDIICFLKDITKSKNIPNIVGDIAKCEEGYIVDILNSHVNTILNTFSNTESEYKKKGIELSHLMELPPLIKEKKITIRKKKKAPWIKYKLQKKQIIVLGCRKSKYRKREKEEIIKEINTPLSI